MDTSEVQSPNDLHGTRQWTMVAAEHARWGNAEHPSPGPREGNRQIPLTRHRIHIWSEFRVREGHSASADGVAITHLPYQLNQDGTEREGVVRPNPPDWFSQWEGLAGGLGGRRECGVFVFPTTAQASQVLAMAQKFFAPMGCEVALDDDMGENGPTRLPTDLRLEFL
jgi:hypothetical protein